MATLLFMIFLCLMILSVVMTIIGLISPQIIFRHVPQWPDNKRDRKHVFLYGAITLCIFTVAMVTAAVHDAPPKQNVVQTQQSAKSKSTSKPIANSQSKTIDSNTAVQDNKQAVAPSTQSTPKVQQSAAPRNSNTGPNGETIKGNINRKGEKIYHVPGGASYNKVNPEAWFFTEEDAQAAGFRRAKR